MFSESGCLIFDDTVLEKIFSFKIEAVRRQYSGNKHGIINGIGVVNCMYFKPETAQYWVLDFRVFDPKVGVADKGFTQITATDAALDLAEQNIVMKNAYALLGKMKNTAEE